MASHAPTSAAGPGPDEIPNAGTPVPDTAAPHRRRAWLRSTLIAIVATIAIIATAIAIASAHSHSPQSQYPHTTATTQAPQSAATTVTLSKYYASNMVLQRDVPITIRGTVHVPTTDAAATTDTADAAATTDTTTSTPSLRHTLRAFNVRMVSDEGVKDAKMHVDDDGAFTATFTPTPGSPTPHVVEFRMSSTPVRVLANVVFGDVFLASGQSNMELNITQYYGNADAQYSNTKGRFTMRDLPAPITDADVRFTVAGRTAGDVDFPALYDTDQRWLTATDTESTNALSFLAQSFAQHVREADPTIPVGIVQTAWSGTAIARHEVDGDIYASHIKPLRGVRLAGMLWYQGCADAHRSNTVRIYTQQMVRLINQYRADFDDDDLPFLYVQLARFVTDDDFRGIREQQLDVLKSPQLNNADNIGMTVSIDTDKGTDAVIHPLGKDVLGARMAAQWLAMRQGQTVPNGPIIEEATTVTSEPTSKPTSKSTKNSPSSVRLTFAKGTADALGVRVPNRKTTADIDDISTTTSKALEGFEVAGADGAFVPAKAAIDGDTVVLTSDDVDEIRSVRYLYENDPQEQRLLYNGDLPASPFEIDVTR